VAPVITTVWSRSTDDVPGLMTVTCVMATVDWARDGVVSAKHITVAVNAMTSRERIRMRGEGTTSCCCEKVDPKLVQAAFPATLAKAVQRGASRGGRQGAREKA
jgi:hypothetical protein